VPIIEYTPLLKLPDNPFGRLPEEIETLVAKPPIVKVMGLIKVLKHKVCIGLSSEILGNGLIIIVKFEVEKVWQMAGFAVIV
jgi:hypothetical protein